MKKNTLTILAAIFMATTIIAQTVTTYTDGTPDDGIAIDSNGNLYASNWSGDTVFKYDENKGVAKIRSFGNQNLPSDFFPQTRPDCMKKNLLLFTSTFPRWPGEGALSDVPGVPKLTERFTLLEGR